MGSQPSKSEDPYRLVSNGTLLQEADGEGYDNQRRSMFGEGLRVAIITSTIIVHVIIVIRMIIIIGLVVILAQPSSLLQSSSLCDPYRCHHHHHLRHDHHHQYHHHHHHHH